MMRLAHTIHRWATHLPLLEPNIHAKPARARKQNQQVRQRRIYQGSRLPRAATRARYIRMHMYHRRHRQHGQ
jgi:hypothetical protein